jgi:hypothetical protein
MDETLFSETDIWKLNIKKAIPFRILRETIQKPVTFNTQITGYRRIPRTTRDFPHSADAVNLETGSVSSLN